MNQATLHIRILLMQHMQKGLKVIQDVVFNHTGNFGETNLFPMIEKQGDLSSSDCMKTLPNSGLPTDYNQLLPARQYDARI